MKLIAPFFDIYAGQLDEQNLFSQALEKVGVSYVPWNVHEEKMPEGDAIFWQAVSGYHKQMKLFNALLEEVENCKIMSLNSTSIMRWNAEKTYLQELEKKVIPIIPTLWQDEWNTEEIIQWTQRESHQEIIIKPVISAGAYLTFRTDGKDKTTLDEIGQKYREAGKSKIMIQPFRQEIIDEGEWSFLFFGGAFSHAVLKTPKKDDYRIQHVHGGAYRSVTPNAILMESARKVIQELPEEPHYARVDGIHSKDGFLLMEVELIEPYFYLDVATERANMFAENIRKSFEIPQFL